MDISVKVIDIFDGEKPTKAVCAITLDNMFTVHGVKVIEGVNGKFVGFPFRALKDDEGKPVRKDVFHPITAEAREILKNAVITAYEAELAKRATA